MVISGSHIELTSSYIERIKRSQLSIMHMTELSNSILDAGVRIGGDYRKLVKNNKDGSRWFEQVTKTTNSIRDIIKIAAFGELDTEIVFQNRSGDSYEISEP